MKGSYRQCILPALVLLAIILRTNIFAEDKPSDIAITSYVNMAIVEDPRIQSSEIHISTDNGIVTLSGIVQNLAAKMYADKEAKKIKGVRGVVNQIEVATRYRPDTDLALDIRHRIINSPTIKSPYISVKVENGAVTLDGTVDSWAEAQQAVLLATETAGVKSVKSNLSMNNKTKRADSEIKGDVSAKVGRDIYLVGMPIEVNVEKGVVKLNGKVGNAFQKERAYDDVCFIPGVKSVQNELKVEWWREEGVRKKIVKPSDADLEKAVKDELNEDLRIADPFELKVEAASGHVTLSGIVPSYHSKLVAETDAGEVVGVIWVTNLLKVKYDWREDQSLRDDVKLTIATDFALNSDDINVTVNRGRVTLSGDVANFYEKVQCELDAAKVTGVVDVINKIRVNLQPKYSDASIKKRVISHMEANWETWPVVDKITVSVKNGKVTLSGNVYNWAEYNQVARVAFLTDGVWAVENNLTIENVGYPWKELQTTVPDAYLYDYDPYYNTYRKYYYPPLYLYP